MRFNNSNVYYYKCTILLRQCIENKYITILYILNITRKINQNVKEEN